MVTQDPTDKLTNLIKLINVLHKFDYPATVEKKLVMCR